jgi:predicted DNA-binding protein (MmcQ/YjbR family)
MNIEQLRNLCLSLPHATEDVKWKTDLCFCIGEKMFCVTSLEPEKEGATLKVKPEEFEVMIARPGILPASYVARYHFIWLAKWAALSEAEWDFFVRQSYELTKAKLPPKLRKALE